jgi:hypothetical protein
MRENKVPDPSGEQSKRKTRHEQPEKERVTLDKVWELRVLVAIAAVTMLTQLASTAFQVTSTRRDELVKMRVSAIDQAVKQLSRLQYLSQFKILHAFWLVQLGFDEKGQPLPPSVVRLRSDDATVHQQQPVEWEHAQEYDQAVGDLNGALMVASSCFTSRVGELVLQFHEAISRERRSHLITQGVLECKGDRAAMESKAGEILKVIQSELESSGERLIQAMCEELVGEQVMPFS